jgi:hypothetical protein
MLVQVVSSKFEHIAFHWHEVDGEATWDVQWVGVQKRKLFYSMGKSLTMVDTKVVESVIVRDGIKRGWIIAEVGFEWKKICPKVFQIESKVSPWALPKKIGLGR